MEAILMEAIKVDIWLSAFVQKSEANRNSGLLCWMTRMTEFCLQDSEETQRQEAPGPGTAFCSLSDSKSKSLFGSACPRDPLCWESG